MIYNIFMLIVFTILLTDSHAFAANNKQFCDKIECVAGTKVITYSSKTEHYFACQSREIAEYTNTTLAMIVMIKQLTGQTPNISDSTGEPEVVDESKQMLAQLRIKARVSGMNQALDRCSSGKNKLKATVLNNPKDNSVIYVLEDKSNKTYWVPKYMVHKIPSK